MKMNIKKIGFCLFFTTSFVLIDFVMFKLKIFNEEFSLFSDILRGIIISVGILILTPKKKEEKKDKESTDEK